MTTKNTVHTDTNTAESGATAEKPHATGRRNNSVTLRFLAAPNDILLAGAMGVHGGRVLEWIDKAAYACAVGWSGAYCVTAYVGHIHFTRPIPSGHLVEVKSTIAYTRRSSMHIVNEVFSADPRDGSFSRACDCLVIFVALDEHGKSIPVPTWTPTTEEEIRVRDAALSRVDLRKAIEDEMLKQTYTEDSTAPELVTRFMAKPQDVNWGGKVHGGTAMAWIDEAATACTMEFAGHRTVAVYAGGIRFYRPIQIGDLIEADARIIRTDTRSMQTSVHVYAGDPREGRSGMKLAIHASSAYMGIDEDGNPLAARHFTPTTEEDKRLAEHAETLRNLRAEYSPHPLVPQNPISRRIQ